MPVPFGEATPKFGSFLIASSHCFLPAGGTAAHGLAEFGSRGFCDGSGVGIMVGIGGGVSLMTGGVAVNIATRLVEGVAWAGIKVAPGMEVGFGTGGD